jgi:uncharacterized protein (DUF1697 family)
MQRHVAFLRGVSPMNCRMADLKRSFEAAGFADVRTLLSSGNVAFSAPPASAAALARRTEAPMEACLGRTFEVFVRPSALLQRLVARAPFDAFDLPGNAKRVVTFLGRPPAALPRLPIERGRATILGIEGTEVLSAYVPDENGPVFMALLEKTFGKAITTRTLDTVRRCSLA